MSFRTLIVALLAAVALCMGSDARANQDDGLVTGRLTHFTDRIISVNGQDFRPPAGRRIQIYGPVQVGRHVVVRYTVINGGEKCATHVKALPSQPAPRGLAARELFSVNVTPDD